jgi:three-Cys-motif partner protein
VLFVDGFAGPGRYVGGEPGSPLVALQCVTEHHHDLSSKELLFLFIEENSARHQHLEQAVAELALPTNVKAHTHCGSFAETTESILDRLGTNDMAPAFIMIDPFGVKGVPLETIGRLAAYRKTELLISLMYESMNRFLTTKEFDPHLDQMFGGEAWRGAIPLQGHERHQFLVDLYASGLKNIGMEHTRTFEMRDDGNRTEYDLVFATHSIEGIKAMKDAMWKMDPSGSYAFSDATQRDQLTLFAAEPDFGQLTVMVRQQFTGQRVSVEKVEEFVVLETPFRETHYKRQVLVPMEKNGQLRVVAPSGRRNGTFPAGTVIQFQ